MAHLPRSILRHRSLQKGKSSSVRRTSIPQVGQRRSLTDFFLAVIFYSTLQRPSEDAGDYVVVVGFGDLGAVETAGLEGGQVAEVVDVEFAVDLRGVELCAAFPEERGLFAFAFGEHDQLAAYPLLLGTLGDGLLELHEFIFAGFDGAVGNLLVERKCSRAFFIGIVEDA